MIKVRFPRLAQGMSLLESLLVTSIFLAAMGLIGFLFLQGSRFTGSGGERTELVEVRLKIADALRRAMGSSYQSGNTAFYITPGTQKDLAICLISTLNTGGQRGWDAAEQKPIFSGYEVYYRDAVDDSLNTFRIDIAPTSIALPMTEADLRARIGATPGQTLAVGVDTFQLFSPQDGSVLASWTNPIGLRFVLGTSRGTPIATEIPFRLSSL